MAKPLNGICKKFGMNAEGVMGMVVALANSVPVFAMIKDMNPKGKVINSAWLVCAAASLGAHLGYTSAVAPAMIPTLLIGKLSAGLIAVLFAALTKAEKIS